MNPYSPLHLVAALAALLIGLVMLRLPKGIADTGRWGGGT